MDLKYKIVEVSPENIRDHPQAICFIKRENAHCSKKVEWYGEHYKEGVRIKLFYTEDMTRSIGFIEEVKPVLKNEKLNPTVVEIKSAAQAQRAPSAYGVFNLVYKGKVLSDRYISTTRFSNIIRKNVKGK